MAPAGHKVAGFWHIIWIAGVGILVSGLVGVTVHTAGYTWLERRRETDRRESEEHDDLGPTAGD